MELLPAMTRDEHAISILEKKKKAGLKRILELLKSRNESPRPERFDDDDFHISISFQEAFWMLNSGLAVKIANQIDSPDRAGYLGPDKVPGLDGMGFDEFDAFIEEYQSYHFHPNVYGLRFYI